MVFRWLRAERHKTCRHLLQITSAARKHDYADGLAAASCTQLREQGEAVGEIGNELSATDPRRFVEGSRERFARAIKIPKIMVQTTENNRRGTEYIS